LQTANALERRHEMVIFPGTIFPERQCKHDGVAIIRCKQIYDVLIITVQYRVSACVCRLQTFWAGDMLQ
jgi:hypothetical protein